MSQSERKFHIRRPSDHSIGIMCVIIAAFGFSLMTFFVRQSGDLPTLQKAFFRNAFAALIAVISLVASHVREKRELTMAAAADPGHFVPVATGRRRFITPGCGRDIFFRCLFGTSGMIANFYAIDRLGIADANMLNKLSPFFAILLSIPILREKPSKVDWASVLIAFLGALLIIRPGTNLALIPALLGVYGGFGAGTAYVFVRSLGRKGERTTVIVLCFSLFSCLVSAPQLIFAFHPMTGQQWLCLCMAGVSAAIGQFGITTAYKFAPAKDISVFDYTQVVFAAILGMLFLGETPVPLSILGYFIIIGTAFFRWHLARRRHTAAT
ncbi:MAG: DMT family transporter [Eubacterium sp.]|nr:DMT family transporter [Eubacterium sp.]